MQNRINEYEKDHNAKITGLNDGQIRLISKD